LGFFVGGRVGGGRGGFGGIEKLGLDVEELLEGLLLVEVVFLER
jgi:hypothetical protein